MNENCHNCRFFHSVDGKWPTGFCNRFPPSIVKDGAHIFPTTCRVNTCGEFSAKEKPGLLYWQESFPDTCAGCGASLKQSPHEVPLCGKCRNKLSSFEVAPKILKAKIKSVSWEGRKNTICFEFPGNLPQCVTTEKLGDLLRIFQAASLNDLIGRNARIEHTQEVNPVICKIAPDFDMWITI